MILDTLENVLRQQITDIDNKKFPVTEFRLAVQDITSKGIRVTAHPMGVKGVTGDFIVKGNTLHPHTLSNDADKSYTVTICIEGDNSEGIKKVIYSDSITRERLLLLIGKDRTYKCTISYNDGVGFKLFNDVDIVAVSEGMVFSIYPANKV